MAEKKKKTKRKTNPAMSKDLKLRSMYTRGPLVNSPVRRGLDAIPPAPPPAPSEPPPMTREQLDLLMRQRLPADTAVPAAGGFGRGGTVRKKRKAKRATRGDGMATQGRTRGKFF